MQNTRTVLLVIGLLRLEWLSLGLSEVEDQPGTLSEYDYSDWPENQDIKLVNYVAKVGSDVDILSPITPPPLGMRWFSLNYDGELRLPNVSEVDGLPSSNSENSLKAQNTSWQIVLQIDSQNRWLRIRRVRLDYADLFRVFVQPNKRGETNEGSPAEGQTFDVAITLLTFEKHECGFTSKPPNPEMGDLLTLNCSVIVNGMWNASLVFHNGYDESRVEGETHLCGIQPIIGSKICSSVKVNAEADILAYYCRVEFPSQARLIPKNPTFQNSKWTFEFNEEVACYLPKVYLQALPSDVSLLCNNMPCGKTAEIDDIVTCSAHGYPQPVFDLRIRAGIDVETRLFLDTDEEERDDLGSDGNGNEGGAEAEIKDYKDIRIEPKHVGRIEVTCNVSNALGYGYTSVELEIRGLGHPTFHVDDYESPNRHIHLVNYIAEVGSSVVIMSPILPAPTGIRWHSLIMDGDMEVELANSSNSENTPRPRHRAPWEIAFEYDEHRRWVKIQKVPLGYCDVFRVFVDVSRSGSVQDKTSFDVAISLMTFEHHECGYASKPPRPSVGDTLVLQCSVVIIGWWNASLSFRNAYDDSEIRGETTDCNDQPETGLKICSTVKIEVETDILAYSCRLDFPSIARHNLSNPVLQKSKWTDAFNTEAICYLPEIYLEVIPSSVSFLCNNMPCEDTASVNDTITCVGHGYPAPLFRLNVRHISAEQNNKSNNSDVEVQIIGTASHRLSQADVGRVEITCNVSNELGHGISSMTQEISARPPEVAGEVAAGMLPLDRPNYAYWLKNHSIKLVNYVAKVGMDVLIVSPITPAPSGIQWFSQNLNGKVSQRESKEVSPVTSRNLATFQAKHNVSWHSVFRFDTSGQWLNITNVVLDYADVFRVVASEKMSGNSALQTFDVLITLVVVENHMCGFIPKPQNPRRMGDTLILNCSAVVNGLWGVSLVFINVYDGSKMTGETKTCGRQPRIGSRICSTVNVRVDTVITAYVCRLEFLSNRRLKPIISANQSSTWTDDFDTDVDCYLPKVYLEAIPSEVTFLCNHMPCGNTVLVNDTVTCVAHGYPQPVFNFRIQKHSSMPTSEDDDVGSTFINTTDESSEVDIKGFEDYKIKQEDVGHVNLLCNVSNNLGRGSKSLDLEIKEGAIPSGVKILCNQMPCGKTVFVDDTVTCLAYGNPQPVVDIRIEKVSLEPITTPGSEDSGEVIPAFMDPAGQSSEMEIKGFQDYKIMQKDVGQVKIVCNVWNALGRGYSSLTVKVMSKEESISTLVPVIQSSVSYETRVSSVSILCNGVRCEENRLLFVGDAVECIGDGTVSFDRFVLVVQGRRTVGHNRGVKYVVELPDVGYIDVECIAHYASGFVSVKTVPINVRDDTPGHGGAAGVVDVKETNQFGWDPPDGDEESESAVQKDEAEAVSASPGDASSQKASVGNGRGGSVFMQLFYASIAAFVGLAQF